MARVLPSSGLAVMKRAIAIGLEAFEPSHLVWGLLAGELSLALLMVASDRLPVILIRSLQLFLRF